MYLAGWLAWPVQDGYDNERGDDSLSGQSDQMEQNINHPHYHSSQSVLLMKKDTNILWKSYMSIFMNMINQ